MAHQFLNNSNFDFLSLYRTDDYGIALCFMSLALSVCGFALYFHEDTVCAICGIGRFHIKYTHQLFPFDHILSSYGKLLGVDRWRNRMTCVLASIATVKKRWIYPRVWAYTSLDIVSSIFKILSPMMLTEASFVYPVFL
jgi:hypothetical protein